MPFAGKTMRGAGLFSAGQLAVLGLSFARNLILARMLTPAEFGIAATFALAMTFLEMSSDLSVEKLLVQASEERLRGLRPTVHTVQLLRGLLIGGLLVALGGPLAAAFGTPEYAWAFRSLGLLPSLRGLANLDVVVRQRDLSYRALVLCQVGSHGLAALVAWPLCHWRPDAVAALAVLVTQMATYVALTHLLSSTPQRFGLQRAALTRILRFGWPLTLNGVLMAAILQGDRTLIGLFRTKAELGHFAVASGATLLLGVLVLRVHAAVSLPLLARARSRPARFLEQYQRDLLALAFAAGGLVILFVVVGEPLVLSLYGSQYGGVARLLPWLAALQAVRLFRNGPALAALALGDTRNPLMANVARSLALPVAAGLLAAGAPLVSLVVAGLIGEVAAFATSLGLLQRTQGIHPGRALCIAVPPTLIALAAQPLARTRAFDGSSGMGLSSLLVLVLWIALAASLFPMLRQAYAGRDSTRKSGGSATTSNEPVVRARA